MSLDYKLAVPSRGRSETMPSLLSLVPTAHICVEASERDAYAKHVAPERLWLHPPLGGYVPIIRWMQEQNDRESLVVVNDDLVHIQVRVGRRCRTIRDAGAILQIIENGVRVLVDLDLSVYGWSRAPGPLEFKGSDPFGLVAPAMESFILRGRRVLADPSVGTRGDLDWVLQSLLRDRVVVQDRRYYWNFGGTWEGKPGGQQGVRTKAQDDSSTRVLKSRWGPYIEFEAKGGGTVGAGFRVPRRSQLAR